jgi:hypothetical protein
VAEEHQRVLEREAAILETAAGDAVNAALEALDEHADALAAKLTGRREKLCGALITALEKVTRLKEEFSAILALYRLPRGERGAAVAGAEVRRRPRQGAANVGGPRLPHAARGAAGGGRGQAAAAGAGRGRERPAVAGAPNARCRMSGDFIRRALEQRRAADRRIAQAAGFLVAEQPSSRDKGGNEERPVADLAPGARDMPPTFGL